MSKPIRIGTRDSQLAVWQATLVQGLLKEYGNTSELVYIKSEGDLDTITPLYALGVQGIFTKTLDTALLNNRIDMAVHSMKDVPIQLAQGIRQAAVLKRASYKDILVYKDDKDLERIGYVNGQWISLEFSPTLGTVHHPSLIIATSSIRRMAQWLNRYPDHQFENLRGNVNTRLQKLQSNNWNGAIFAAAGLERIQLRPENSVDLDWMLPAPAQGAIMVVCRENDDYVYQGCQGFNDTDTARCTKIERDFLQTLLGGCSTPISGLAQVENGNIRFRGNMVTPDGKNKVEIDHSAPIEEGSEIGVAAAMEILQKGGQEIIEMIRKNEISSYGEV